MFLSYSATAKINMMNEQFMYNIQLIYTTVHQPCRGVIQRAASVSGVDVASGFPPRK